MDAGGLQGYFHRLGQDQQRSHEESLSERSQDSAYGRRVSHAVRGRRMVCQAYGLLDIGYQVSGIRYQVSGIRHQVSGINVLLTANWLMWIFLLSIYCFYIYISLQYEITICHTTHSVMNGHYHIYKGENIWRNS